MPRTTTVPSSSGSAIRTTRFRPRLSSTACPALAALALLTPAAATAGGWVQDEDRGYARLSFNHYRADRNLDDDGNWLAMPNQGAFTDYNLGVYLDYGLTNDLTLLCTTQLKRIEYADHAGWEEGRTTWGFADVEIGLKRALLTEPVALAFQTSAKLPPYDEDADLPLGNGQADLEARVLAGTSFRLLGTWGYGGIELAYRARAEEPSDEWRVLAELGVDLAFGFYARTKADLIFSAGNGDLGTVTNPTLTNEYDLYRLELTLGCHVDDSFMLELAWMPTLLGRNTSYGDTWSSGAAARF